MFLKNTAYFYFVLLIGVFVTACKKAPNYAKEPLIEFSNLKVTSNSSDLTDSVYISVHFKDGDGDIGNDPLADKDFLVKIYKKEAGVFNYLDLGVFDYSGNLPKFSEFVGPIDGTITQVLPFDYIIPNDLDFNKDDTLRFEIQIKDRANNFSNTVQTSEYVLWKNF